MNSFEEHGHRHEIIIVKRGHADEEEGHHGGVWKIAFADFMTAMMCFFLVMWLINAADEETRTALASYFNPVNLVDRNSASKGLHEPEGLQPTEPEDEQDDAQPPASTPKSDAAPSTPDDDKHASDEHLFSDPYAVLAEIAADTGVKQNVSSKGDGGAQTSGPATGASGGESYRDPFAPDFWSRQVQGVETVLPVEDAERATTEAEVEKQPSPQTADAAQPEASQESEAEPQPATIDDKTPEPGADQIKDAVKPETEIAEKEPERPQTTAEAETQARQEKPAEEQTESDAGTAETADQRQPTSKQMEAAEMIRREVAEALGADATLSKGISVSATDRGVVISITDQLNFGMFEIGSAVPRREMVLAMEKIGKILGERNGNVIVNGHTDGRPFKGGGYDNWRLSTARAHSAYYMLVRGGLNEQRIVEVAGFADRKLKIADNPLADANRRIEVMLELGG